MILSNTVKESLHMKINFYFPESTKTLKIFCTKYEKREVNKLVENIPTYESMTLI